MDTVAVLVDPFGDMLGVGRNGDAVEFKGGSDWPWLATCLSGLLASRLSRRGHVPVDEVSIVQAGSNHESHSTALARSGRSRHADRAALPEGLADRRISQTFAETSGPTYSPAQGA